MGNRVKEDVAVAPVVRRFIEDAGNASQSLGVGRVLGQIYAYLYFSASPRCLADLQNVLGISKGSASICVRQLEQWGAVRKIWVKGDRKDYYEANDWFGQILKNAAPEGVECRDGNEVYLRQFDCHSGTGVVALTHLAKLLLDIFQRQFGFVGGGFLHCNARLCLNARLTPEPWQRHKSR